MAIMVAIMAIMVVIMAIMVATITQTMEIFNSNNLATTTMVVVEIFRD